MAPLLFANVYLSLKTAIQKSNIRWAKFMKGGWNGVRKDYSQAIGWYRLAAEFVEEFNKDVSQLDTKSG